jgi:transcriptional regulator with XRE-family HTH domain
MAKKTVKPRPKGPERKNFIRKWRKFRDRMSLERLADRVGTSHASLSRIERGKQDWNESLLYALADALQTDWVSLLIRDPTDPEGIWTVWDHAKPTERRKIVQMAKVILGTGTDG